ncbi:FAD synthetase family protein [Siminovitchia acidinfaciens]|uniref:Riboflavin biosynthesis protein n=1 Tax=Siminovitchia acidinfaciens TaxID=2321395 RepID=A0A429XWW9_9BACI|nr:FAD synthetase family protein [Siminovitchia acidinfaciens]RST72998.1 FAD synthetase family protein [Siminovitchia acidinfaciens]
MQTVYIKGPLDTKALTNDPCIIALGFFDGVHLGHRELIETARKIAKQKDLTLSVMTFFPHPSNVLPTKRKINRYLSPLDAKKEMFKELGVEKLFIVTFSHDFAKLAPADFVKSYICGLNCKHVVAGFDFTYGYRGQGNMQRIEEDGGGQFDITVVSKKSYKNKKISSTKIRELLNEGAVDDIPHYLGNHYCTSVEVESETFNLKTHTVMLTVSFKDYLLPRSGTYLVRVETDQDVLEGICTLSEKVLGFQNIHVLSKESVTMKSRIKIKWLTELEALSISETANMMKKAQMVV